MKASRNKECRSCCPLAGALDILGDRWSLLVIRDLMLFNRHEYKDFLKSPEGIATNILADRLQCLKSLGVIDSMPHPKHKSKKIYYLTQKGKDLLPIVVEMVIWGGTYNASPEMPRAQFNALKRDPQKFIRGVLKDIKVWEEKNPPAAMKLHRA